MSDLRKRKQQARTRPKSADRDPADFGHVANGQGQGSRETESVPGPREPSAAPPEETLDATSQAPVTTDPLSNGFEGAPEATMAPTPTQPRVGGVDLVREPHKAASGSETPPSPSMPSTDATAPAADGRNEAWTTNRGRGPYPRIADFAHLPEGVVQPTGVQVPHALHKAVHKESLRRGVTHVDVVLEAIAAAADRISDLIAAERDGRSVDLPLFGRRVRADRRPKPATRLGLRPTMQEWALLEAIAAWHGVAITQLVRLALVERYQRKTPEPGR